MEAMLWTKLLTGTWNLETLPQNKKESKFWKVHSEATTENNNLFLPKEFYLMDHASSFLLFQDNSYLQLSDGDVKDDISDSISDDTLSDEDNVDVTSTVNHN